MKSKMLGAIQELSAPWRLLLTGTPLQNNLQELYTLLDFCAPGSFGTAEGFMNVYGDLKTAEQVSKLQKAMAPYVLRRVKEDVEKSIPAKEETIIDVELTMMQKQCVAGRTAKRLRSAPNGGDSDRASDISRGGMCRYYRAIFEKNRSFLYKVSAFVSCPVVPPPCPHACP